MAGECGEACNVVKKLRRMEGEPGDPASLEDIDRREFLRAELAKELADIITYVDLLAARMQINLSEAVISKFNEVSGRVGSNIKL